MTLWYFVWGLCIYKRRTFWRNTNQTSFFQEFSSSFSFFEEIFQDSNCIPEVSRSFQKFSRVSRSSGHPVYCINIYENLIFLWSTWRKWFGNQRNTLKFFWLRHVNEVAAHFKKKNKIFVYLLKYPNRESEKILKNEAAETYLEPCQISMMERFCENTNG